MIKLLPLKPERPAAYFKKGFALSNLDELKEAIENIYQAILLDPECDLYKEMLARFLKADAQNKKEKSKMDKEK